MWNIFKLVLRYFIIDNNDKLLITFQQVDVYLNGPIKIHELIKLANQSNNSIKQLKGVLVIEAATITTILKKAKTKLIVPSIKIKKKQKMLCFAYKKHIKGGKNIAPMDLAEYLRKSDVSKFIMTDFYKMDFMKGIAVLVKVDEM